MGIGLLGVFSVASSAGVFLFKDKLFKKSSTPIIAPSNFSNVSTTNPPGTSTTATTATGTIARKFAPYVLLNGKATNLVGTHSKWTTLAFVVGYTNGKIQWDAGAVNTATLKAKIDAAKQKGGGVIVSFGGQGAGASGTKYLSELAGKYTDPQKLADAYSAIATALGAIWLDFDVEERALKDTAAIDRRNKALYLLQQKRTDLRISFTVPTGTNGLDTDTKALLTKVKNSGVRIDLVNIMTMYFTSSKTVMSTSVQQALTAAKPFIKSLGAKIGITPQIGKNPDKPYTHENFTTADATKVVTLAKADPDVALLSFWSLNNDMTKYKGAYSKVFAGFG